MFEKWRIKEHMEIVDSAGQHVGTVDGVEDNRIKLTRSDASDGSHHFLDMDSVDRIDEGRVYLKAGTPLPERETMSATAGSMEGYAGSRTSSTLPGNDSQLFGTSGHGTGMGGSGSGVEN